MAYDSSDVSQTAWRHAAALARHCGAALDVVYVEPRRIGADLMPPPPLTPEEALALRARIVKAVGGEARVSILQGDPVARVLSHARYHRTDLIVVGTHGRGGLKRMLLGSVAEEIIRRSTIPVLAARGPVRPIRAILAPVNFTAYGEFGLAYAAGAAAALKAVLTALHVTDDPIWGGNPRFRLDAVFNRLPAAIRRNCRLEVEIGAGEAAAGILRARQWHDWVVLVAHGKSFVTDALFGTTLERVLRQSRVPVLSVPYSRAAVAAARRRPHAAAPV